MRMPSIITLTAAGSLILGACGNNEAPPAIEATPVGVENASSGPAVPPIDTNGIVVTKSEMRLSFKLGGVVRRLHVQAGDQVKRDERLAEIELTEVNAQVEQARQLAAHWGIAEISVRGG